MPDYISKMDEQFLLWAKTLVAFVTPKVTAFNIQAGALAPIQGELAAYEAAFETAQNPNRGKVDVLTKNEARERERAANKINFLANEDPHCLQWRFFIE